MGCSTYFKATVIFQNKLDIVHVATTLSSLAMLSCVSLSSPGVTEKFHDQNLSKDKTVNPILHLLCQWLYYIAIHYLLLLSIKKKKVAVVSSFPGLPNYHCSTISYCADSWWYFWGNCTGITSWPESDAVRINTVLRHWRRCWNPELAFTSSKMEQTTCSLMLHAPQTMSIFLCSLCCEPWNSLPPSSSPQLS